MKKDRREVICPHCDKNFDIEVGEVKEKKVTVTLGILVTRHPVTEQKFVVTCPKCDKGVEIWL